MATNPRVGITIDCEDPEMLAGFWARFLGYSRREGRPDSPYVTIDRAADSDGPPFVTFQRVPEPKAGKSRAHLDLFVEHAQPMLDEMISCGAAVVSVTEAGEWTTRVLQDPANNEFCLIGPD